MNRAERKMTIVLITNNFPPEVDGVGDYTYCLSRELNARGHQVHVICNTRARDAAADRNIRVYPIVEQWNAKHYEMALAQIRRIQPDWVLLQYVPYSFNAYGMPVSIVKFVRRIKSNGFSLFVFLHEFFIGLQWKAPKATLIALTQIWITRQLCKYADDIGTSTDHYVRILQKWRRGIHQIPIGSIIPYVDLPPPNGKSGANFKIITFGIRDVDVLLRFFTEMRKEIEGVTLIVCGKQRLPAGQTAVEDVHFTGYLPAEDIACWLSSADVFLLPDYVSNQGEGGTCLKSSALAAAFAVGLPIIGMKGKMNDRLLCELDAVQLVDYYDFETWKSAVLNIYRQRNGREQMRTSVRNFYDKHLAWRSIGDRYLQVLNHTTA